MLLFIFLLVSLIAALVVALVVIGYWLGFPQGVRFREAHAAGLEPYEVPPHDPLTHAPVSYSGPTLVEQLSLQRVIGGVFVLGGLWHTAAPWIFGYSDNSTAVTSNIASGLALAVAGAVFVALRGGYWVNWVVGLIGLWILFEPHVVGFADQGFAVNEAIWGGPITMLLSLVAALDRWLARADRRPLLAGQF